MFLKEAFAAASAVWYEAIKSPAVGTPIVCMRIGRKGVIFAGLRGKRKIQLVRYTLILEFG